MNTESAIDALTEGQLCGLLATFDVRTPTGSRNHAMTVLMSDCGLRVSEVCALAERDLVVEARHFTAVRVRNGKGGKSAKATLTQRAAVAISRWMNQRAGLVETPHLFCTISRGQATGFGDGDLQPGRAVSHVYVRQMIKRQGVKAGLGEGVHPHLLRHTAITRYLRTNRDLELTRRFARHALVSTTSRIYSHLTDEDVADGVRRMEGESGEAEEKTRMVGRLQELQEEIETIKRQLVP